ncbi:hypothetical protein ABT061_37655 [Streptosporangium sp. NPDC002544]
MTLDRITGILPPATPGGSEPAPGPEAEPKRGRGFPATANG